MKLVLSELKKLLPGLPVEPQQLRDDLTMIGHFTNFYEKIDDEIIFDLDIKVNRGDCLGYYGLARDLSVLYNLPLVLPNLPQLNFPEYKLPILVTAKNEVKRIQAVKISNLKNIPSPDWLKKFLEFHQINSINTLVDLTNYIMFLYGLPCHAFDTAKSGDNLLWELNSHYSEFVTLDQTTLKLKPGILMVNNPTTPLSLSFLGGQACAIGLKTTETIIEMAVYDRTRVRLDSRFLKTTTEAGTRLEKDLDSDTIPLAFSHLIKLIIDLCHGQVSSQLFDYYPEAIALPKIKFDPQKPSVYSGIDIPVDFSLNVLQQLGCIIQNELVTPPSIRKDITLEEDLTEEVIRFWGYQKIPTNQPISNTILPDITPKIIYLTEYVKDVLTNLGYDEIRSWPLTQKPVDPNTVITTQNSINSEYPYLRQSLVQSLKVQLDQYDRYKLPAPQFFEIGKIFSQKDGQYLEKYSLGLYHSNSGQLSADIQALSEKLNAPLSPLSDGNFSEIILDDLKVDISNSIAPAQNYHSYELTSQIITLDANVNYDSKQNPVDLINHYSSLISPDLLWQIVITDVYHDQKTNKYRYTFRVSYYNCDDKTAKSTHLSVFNLL
ncbi:MAG: phenylalanine--tRNA ligase beta subunit-related protein [Candidatus Shapirobacteria bacterium]